MSIFEELKRQQRAWLETHTGAAFDGRGYATTLSANLRGGLSEAARRELRAGRGQELGTEERPGKLAAPWSSTALVINVFDFWRGRDLRPLAAALGAVRPFTGLQQEAKFPTGFGGERAPANLDVVLDGDPLLAIESKFLEPYQSGNNGKRYDDFEPVYLDDMLQERWLGMKQLRALAKSINKGDQVFRWLDAPQLIKHTLGLRLAGKPFELLLLWYRPREATEQAAKMEGELADLRKAMLADGVAFRALTYQELFARLRDLAGNMPDAPDYLAYLESRYFGGGGGAS